MAHHDHAHDDTYFLDQVCLVGLSAAFGAICVALYVWQTSMLMRMLGAQFHLVVFISGIVLLVLSFVRGAVLWVQVGKVKPHTHDHDHEHGHDHTHDDGHEHAHDHSHGHDHSHTHDTCHDHGCTHDHSHEHIHEHHHHHEHAGHHDHGHHGHADHDHADHDHGWAPWRYVVLMVPIILFLLGFPNKGPKVKAEVVDIVQDTSKQAKGSATWLAMGPPSWDQLGALHVATRPRVTGNAREIDFKTLEGAATREELRQYWGAKSVKVRGQFVPNPGNDRVFSLARFKIQCCAGDATQLNVPMLANESIRHVSPNDWIIVTGEVEFYPQGNGFRTILRVNGKEDVKKTVPDPNPYIS